MKQMRQATTHTSHIKRRYMISRNFRFLSPRLNAALGKLRDLESYWAFENELELTQILLRR